MELSGDSSVGDFCFFSLLVHVQILLVLGLVQSGSRDAFANLLVPHSRLSVRAKLLTLTDFETVHLRLQSNKLDDWIALSLVIRKTTTLPMFGSLGVPSQLG